MILPAESKFVIFSVCLPTLGFICLYFLFKPFLKLKGLITEIQSKLTEFSNLNYGRRRDPKIHDDFWNKCDGASSVIRNLASQLEPLSNNIHLYPLFACGRLLPSKPNIQEAVSRLFRISNNIISHDPADASHIHDDEREVRRLLSQ